MFVLLSRVLLWLLLVAILVALFQRFYPTGTFVGRLLLVVLFLIIVLSFINPTEPAVASLWRVVSFPLKPLGAAILLLILAAQKIKAGAVDKPGGIYIAWALTILLLASTPAVAYFLVRSPAADYATGVPRRELRLEDFVPNAETLAVTTKFWESYLNQVYFFLRGR